MTLYLPTTNTPGHLPDSDYGPHDEITSAWGTLVESRDNYEEQQVGYEELPAYTLGRDVLKQLAYGEFATARRLAELNEDGQVAAYAVDDNGLGHVILQTSLDWRTDHSLPEVFAVTATEESE